MKVFFRALLGSPTVWISGLLFLSLLLNYNYFNKDKRGSKMETIREIFIEKKTAKDGTNLLVTNKVIKVPIEKIPDSILTKLKNMEIEKSKVENIIKINQELQLKLTEKDMILDDKEKELKKWKTKFDEVTVDNKNNTVEVKSDVSPIITQEYKRNRIFGPKETVISVSSNNPNLYFEGATKFEIIPRDKKAFFELSVDVNTGKLMYQVPYSQGLRYYNGMLKLEFNPDGTLRPYLYGGANTFLPEYFYRSSVWTSYLGVGLNVKILKY